MHCAPPQVHHSGLNHALLISPTFLARLHKKIRRSKKLTRLLLGQSPPLRLTPQTALLASGGTCLATLLPAAPIPALASLKCVGVPLTDCDTPKDPSSFPAVQVIRTGPVDVFGHSHFLRTPQGQLVHHDLFMPANHMASEEDHRRLQIEPASHTARIVGAPLSTGALPAAAVFTDAVAQNYAHWLTEVLPRIVLYTRHACSQSTPLIVDEGLHPNLYESLALAVGPERLVYTLPKDRFVRVKSLDVVTPAGYVPYSSRAPRKPGHSHGVFSPQALQTVREAFKHLMTHDAASARKRIYVRRNSGLRKLVNDQEISDLMAAAGFIVIEPEKLTFTEQVRLFSQAELVVGATGAAMANLIFCPPGTRVHVLMAQHVDMPYWYWKRLADCVDVDLSYGLGKVCGAPEKGFHADFRVSPESVQDVLDEHLLAGKAPQRTAS